MAYGIERIEWQTLPDTGFATLDESLWKPLLGVEERSDPKEALRRRALLADDDAGGCATVAGVLLCTRKPHEFVPNAVIAATRYRGGDRASGHIDAQDICGPLPEQIAGAVRFAVRNMHVGAWKDPARVNMPQYSKKAIFEAVVNAVGHRDYSRYGSRIRLSMFDDRLEIASPGSLPNDLPLDSLGWRQSSRNEVLASVLGRLAVGGIPGGEHRKFVMESRGLGVRIINRETRGLCGQDPVYELIDDAELHLVIPAGPHEPSPGRLDINVLSDGQPVAGADLLVLFPNNTWKRATTDEHGGAEVELHTTELPMTVFAAAPGHAAHLESRWMPSERALTVNLEALPTGGSVIFVEASGQVPGLRGSVSTTRDDIDRTYLYAANISINDGVRQPVHFFPGDELRLTDADGAERQVKIVAAEGRCALLEYDATHPGRRHLMSMMMDHHRRN